MLRMEYKYSIWYILFNFVLHNDQSPTSCDFFCKSKCNLSLGIFCEILFVVCCLLWINVPANAQLDGRMLFRPAGLDECKRPFRCISPFAFVGASLTLSNVVATVISCVMLPLFITIIVISLSLLSGSSIDARLVDPVCLQGPIPGVVSGFWLALFVFISLGTNIITQYQYRYEQWTPWLTSVMIF